MLRSWWSHLSNYWAMPSPGCLIFELFSTAKLVKTEDLRNTSHIPKVMVVTFNSEMLAFLMNGQVVHNVHAHESRCDWHKCRYCVLQALLPDYQKLLASAPARRLNSAKLLENSGEFTLCPVCSLWFQDSVAIWYWRNFVWIMTWTVQVWCYCKLKGSWTQRNIVWT